MRLVVILSSLLLLNACGEKEQASAEKSSSVAGKAQETTAKLVKQVEVTTNSISTACEAISSDQVASIMGWDAGSTKSEETFNMKDGRITVCSYSNPNQDSALSLRVSHENEKSIGFKNLERGFAKYLAEGEDKFTYESLPNSPGTETLYSVADAMHGMKAHILRTRYGNEINTTIEFMSDGSDLDDVKAQLFSISKSLK